MKKLKITAKALRELGYPSSPVIPVAMDVMMREYRHTPYEEVMALLKKVLDNPEDFYKDEYLCKIAEKLKPPVEEQPGQFQLKEKGIPFAVYGREFIEEQAMNQMHQAGKLPVTIGGALMPDAHSGYGLPIGGVLATKNEVIPYGVGVDIGCRMCLSIYDLPGKELVSNDKYYAKILDEQTLFGSGREFKSAYDHAIIDSEVFRHTALLRSLQGRAARQLGSSGSGNHFVEFGKVTVGDHHDELNIPAGEYMAVLSHSGSRGMGASIAQHYTAIAKQKVKLPGEAQNLAWLSLDDEEGIEYWNAMNLAGDYASACHDVIHEKISRALHRRPLVKVENHHNFAWKETWNGEEVIVHRKGATPAAKGVLGIIPGSMSTPGYIVSGNGVQASLNSASHGAGRVMSRTKAKNSITRNELKNALKTSGVTLLGGGLDEAPHAYKDIGEVMKSQQELVTTVGLFQPVIVKMDE